MGLGKGRSGLWILFAFLILGGGYVYRRSAARHEGTGEAADQPEDAAATRPQRRPGGNVPLARPALPAGPAVPDWFVEPGSQARSIRGRVLANNAPVQGVEVWLHSKLFAAPIAVARSTGTGAFEFEAQAADMYVVDTPRDPSSYAVVDLRQARAGAAHEVVLYLQDCERQLRIAGADRRLPSDAKFFLDAPTGFARVLQATPLADGSFRVCMPRGPIRLHAALGSGLSEVSTLVSEAQTDWLIHAQNGSAVTLRVQDEEGRPQDALVFLRKTDGPDSLGLRLSSRTGESGTARMQGVPQGRFDVQVFSRSGSSRLSLDVEERSVSRDVVVAACVPLRLELKDASGPAVGLVVWMHAKDGRLSRSGVSDLEGRLELPCVALGPNDLLVQDFPGPAGTLVVTADHATQVVEVAERWHLHGDVSGLAAGTHYLVWLRSPGSPIKDRQTEGVAGRGFDLMGFGRESFELSVEAGEQLVEGPTLDLSPGSHREVHLQFH